MKRPQWTEIDLFNFPFFFFPLLAEHCAERGFNFKLFWNFNWNQTENDRYWQKNKYEMFENVRFCAFCVLLKI